MRTTPLITSLALAFLFSPAAAQIHQGRPLEQQDDLRFSGSGHAVAATWGGASAGGCFGRLETPTTPALGLYCIDYSHYATSQRADVTPRSRSSGPGATRNGSFGIHQRTAYLSALFGAWQRVGTNERTVSPGIHAALWRVTNGASLGWGGTASPGAPARTRPGQATAAAGHRTDGWYIRSPGKDANPGADGQEFLIRAPSTVPEPSTYLLMGTGLLVLGLVGWKRRSAASQGEEA